MVKMVKSYWANKGQMVPGEPCGRSPAAPSPIHSLSFLGPSLSFPHPFSLPPSCVLSPFDRYLPNKFGRCVAIRSAVFTAALSFRSFLPLWLFWPFGRFDRFELLDHFFRRGCAVVQFGTVAEAQKAVRDPISLSLSLTLTLSLFLSLSLSLAPARRDAFSLPSFCPPIHRTEAASCTPLDPSFDHYLTPRLTII